MKKVLLSVSVVIVVILAVVLFVQTGNASDNSTIAENETVIEESMCCSSKESIAENTEKPNCATGCCEKCAPGCCEKCGSDCDPSECAKDCCKKNETECDQSKKAGCNKASQDKKCSHKI